MSKKMVKRLVVILVIEFLIASVHIFRVGSYLPGKLYNYYYSYFSDIIIPFGCYFLLCANEFGIPILRRWETKFAISIFLPSIAETCQLFGISVLGSTFDVLDYVMYGIGAIFAIILDTKVFSRIFGFWNIEKAERS